MSNTHQANHKVYPGAHDYNNWNPVPGLPADDGVVLFSNGGTSAGF